MSQIAYIISLNFNPGHVSHLIAGYMQMRDLGYTPVCLVHQKFLDFLPEEVRCAVYGRDELEPCAVAMFLFPSEKNLKLMRRLRRKYRSKILYLFHEPLDSLKAYWSAEKSILHILKTWAVGLVNALTVKLSDAVILPSEKALKLYDGSWLYSNKNRAMIPLMFADEQTEIERNTERKYISYIGTVTYDHAFEEFLTFADYVISEGLYPEVKFLIATRSKVQRDARVEAMSDSGRLELIDGHPLTNQQINVCYAESIVIWNAYNRTTQSGVLVKAFMFGTPAIVLKENLSEFTVHGYNVVAISDNRDKGEIAAAFAEILDNLKEYTGNCRDTFSERFYYGRYNDKVYALLNFK